jgi:hypothetical protein
MDQLIAIFGGGLQPSRDIYFSYIVIPPSGHTLHMRYDWRMHETGGLPALKISHIAASAISSRCTR